MNESTKDLSLHEKDTGSSEVQIAELTNKIENLLWEIEGVGAVNYVTITQDYDYNAEGGSGGYDCYTITLLKTGSGAFVVLGNLSNFA